MASFHAASRLRHNGSKLAGLDDWSAPQLRQPVLMVRTKTVTPQKYFVGKMANVKRGSLYRIFRRRKNKLGFTFDEMEARRLQQGRHLPEQPIDRAEDERMFERTGKG
ncbi:hypothetical protein ACVIHI_008322 [Bradyrhizobium sp. USDA 4524]|uniref:hypothetical protein n=1 Tax=unclassified Bradyrhizobium TaxID=2631580 RepID=UPI00209F13B8|nr:MULTISPECIES: hypothetical protein [unclassified Bradyrhizobium]MCP1838752.1 hypothetical protein [Bradyrhizobium sp. USDA 4538]MCP1899318.1 hypothetical protein [Bradyrhizobium sp. USDA 4537]MCP1986570.1 hypothetical protein [Bradyrhizobium sp. USDA 4539]